jgi:hypothetical protein
MSQLPRHCFIGWGTTPNWEFPKIIWPLRVVYVVPEVVREVFNKNTLLILVEWGYRGNTEGPTRPPKEMLDFREGHLVTRIVEGKEKATWEEESPGWFERKCAEAHCSWFVPMVRQMAAGEEVSLEEIRAAFQTPQPGRRNPPRAALSGEIAVASATRQWPEPPPPCSAEKVLSGFRGLP